MCRRWPYWRGSNAPLARTAAPGWMNSLTAGSALMIICGLPPSVLMIGDNCLSSAQIPLPHLYRHSDTFHPPAWPLLGCNLALTCQVPVSPDFSTRYLPNRGIDPIGARPTPSRRLAGTAQGRDGRGNSGESCRTSRPRPSRRTEILSRLPRNQDWNEHGLVVLSLYFPNSPG